MLDVRRLCSSSVSGNRSLGVRLAGVGPGNCPSLDCLRGLVQHFSWVSYSSSVELQFLHSRAMRAVNWLASDVVDWVMLLTTDLFVSHSWWRYGWWFSRLSRWPRTSLSLSIFDSLFRSSTHSWHEFRQWGMIFVCLVSSSNGVCWLGNRFGQFPD